MVAPFKRSDWNGILQQINALITANGLSAAVLPTVPNGHRWSTADIQARANKLSEISLVPLVFAAPLVKWSQAVVDELNAAIRNCVCVDPTVHVVDMPLVTTHPGTLQYYDFSTSVAFPRVPVYLVNIRDGAPYGTQVTKVTYSPFSYVMWDYQWEHHSHQIAWSQSLAALLAAYPTVHYP